MKHIQAAANDYTLNSPLTPRLFVYPKIQDQLAIGINARLEESIHWVDNTLSAHYPEGEYEAMNGLSRK
jgi:hypothetical protein